jgi:hypothetical protein
MDDATDERILDSLSPHTSGWGECVTVTRRGLPSYYVIGLSGILQCFNAASIHTPHNNPISTTASRCTREVLDEGGLEV